MADLIKGDTVTIGVTFPDTYDPARIINITAALQGREVASLEDESVVATDDPRVFLIKLTSNITRNFAGGIPLTIALTDTILRVKHTKPYGLYFFESPFAMQDAGTKDLIDLNVTLNISEAGLTSNTTLASIYRGYSAYEIAVYKYGYTGTEAEWNTAVNAARVAAQDAATAAGNSATTAGNSAVAANNSAVAAGNSAVAANNSAVAANNSAVAANTKAGEANSSAVNANNSAIAANNSAIAANSSAINANTRAAEAAASQTQAAASAAAAAAIVTGQNTGLSDVLPTINWQFAKSKILPRAISFARNSIATYFDAQGIMRTAAPNQPCFDHDPLTGESLGLASWEARTNLVWGAPNANPGAILTANYATAPDGTQTMLRVQNTPNQSSVVYYNNAGNLANGIYTKSIFAKADGANSVIIFEGVGTTMGSGGSLSFNLNTLTFGGNTAAPVAYGYQSLRNGVYRVWAVVEKSDTKIVPSTHTIYIGTYGSAAENHSVLLWGPDLQLGSFLTPYIPATTGAVTRAMDAFLYSSTLTPAGGTFSLEARTVATSGIQSIVETASGEDFFRLCYNNASILMQSNVAGALVLNLGLAATRGIHNKVSAVYTLNNARYSQNGSVVYTDNSVPTFATTSHRLGFYLNGHIRYLQYYPAVLSDTQLQLLSSAGVNLMGDKPSQIPTAARLGGVAYLSYAEIAALRQRVELNFQGTGAQVSYTIRRPYPFTLAIVNDAGSTIATLPPAPSDGGYVAGNNYTLLHNGPVGTILTVELIPYII